jgi:threonyl-tRNA synthetase
MPKNKIEKIRHSLSHILAFAVQETYPGVKFGIGPAIENGFYYDFDFSNESRITEEALPKIEEKMQELIKRNLKFKKKIISSKEAKEIFKDQPYKLELIEELIRNNQPITVYYTLEDKSKSFEKNLGSFFVDLCKGPHVKSTKEIPIDAFKLVKIAGAYWKGDERNKMLTRVYGLAFENKKELENYLNFEKEVQKRDHRILGTTLDLFHIDENIGPGLILWHPKGAILKRNIINYALSEYLKAGYQLVDTPHIAKINLWKTSGHLDFYKENMFPPMHMEELGEEEKDDYQIKPMNCPFHIAIYKTKTRSYKDLPLRFTEIGVVYRYEKSGTLHGLTRVRQISQDDAHIFCTPEQLSHELLSVLKLTFKILKKFGFKEFQIYLSTKPEKYIGSDKIWQKAESALKFALNSLNLKYEVDKGGGAFYGPKIDIKIKDAIGREWQCTTIQVDFNLPEKFDITFINKNGQKERVIMVHRALLGSLERFIGVLLEYYGGALPFWLAPEKIWVIPIGKRHIKYSEKIAKEIEKYLATLNLENIYFQDTINIRDESETVSRKIREGEIQKIPYLIIIGDKELKSKTIRVRARNKGDIGEMKLEKFLKIIDTDIKKDK